MDNLENKVDGTHINTITELNIDFDETGPQQSTIALLASSKAGKSTLIKTIYNKYYKKVGEQKSPYITILFSINAHIPLYKDFKIKSDVINPKTLLLIKLEHMINKKTDNEYQFLNIFDDCLDVRYKSLLTDLVLTYRNANMSTIISLQYPKLLSPAMRSNINHIFCGWFNNDEAIEQVINFWFRSLFTRLGAKTKDQKIDMYKKITRNHGFIYYCTLNGKYQFIRLKL